MATKLDKVMSLIESAKILTQPQIASVLGVVDALIANGKTSDAALILRLAIKNAAEAQKAELSKAGVAGLAQAGFIPDAAIHARWCVENAAEAQKAELLDVAVKLIPGLAQTDPRAAAIHARWCFENAPEAQKISIQQALGAIKLPRQQLADALKKLEETMSPGATGI